MSSSALRISATNFDAGAQRTTTEQRSRRLVDFRTGEGACAALFFAYAFILLFCYYQLRLLRETLLLADGSAEIKSYAQAAMAAVLMALVPIYGSAFKRSTPHRLVRVITLFFATNIAGFYVLETAGVDIGFSFYVWVGVFGVTMIAQFWAHAAHSFDVVSGQRLFPVIAAGATLGGLVGAGASERLLALLGSGNLLLLSAALLTATVPLVEGTSRAVPPPSRNRRLERNDTNGNALRSGFGLVLRDRYLVALAALVVLLNCVSTTGDYILTELVLRDTALALAANPALEKEDLIANFYGELYFTVNALTVVLQLLLVGRVFRWLGVSGAILALPIFALLGYGLLAAVPIIGLVQLVKVVENSTNYSLMNTARHALFLPLPAAHQYQGKTSIDGFFCRAGDLVQAVVVYAGLHWFGLALGQFAALNAVLAAVWIVLTLRVARHYRLRAAAEPRAARRHRAGRLAAAGLGLAVATAAPTAAADLAVPEPALFASDTPLDLELRVDRDAFCRNPERDGCSDAPGTLLYRAADGTESSIEIKVRSRGRWRKETGDCRLPALFVFFDARTTAGTPFAGHTMLPLTTHCRDRASYEQYVLKEYLAYRIYNALTDKSLRVRLARIVYGDPAGSEHDTTRFGFFTEHFDALARRHAADVWHTETVDLTRVDPQELGTFALFQYMIGNTDWSALYGHNSVALRDATGTASVVPYDFDFSGLVNSEYAGPPPGLPIRSVRERVFRGFCTPAPDWDALLMAFAASRLAIVELTASVPGLQPVERARATAYLDEFFQALHSPDDVARLKTGCRRR